MDGGSKILNLKSQFAPDLMKNLTFNIFQYLWNKLRFFGSGLDVVGTLDCMQSARLRSFDQD
jgi:hypothetical protein